MSKNMFESAAKTRGGRSRVLRLKEILRRRGEFRSGKFVWVGEGVIRGELVDSDSFPGTRAGVSGGNFVTKLRGGPGY